MNKLKNNSTVGNPFAAFKHRNFLYYWIGMAISTMGTSMQNIAQPWLVYKLTNSPFLLGLVSALQFIPFLLLSLFAGVIIDRSKKKNILYITQSMSFAITLVIAILIYSSHIMYWHLIVSSTLLGIVNTFDQPARQSFVIELVGREDLTNGIALNSVQNNMARMIGPAIAGVIMGAGPQGIPICFLINSVSFGAVLLSFLFIHPYPIDRQPIKEKNVLQNIGEGLTFIYHRKAMFGTLLIMAITGTFVMNENILVPVFSEQVLHQHETGFGLLMSMIGIGTLTGAFTMAALAKRGPQKFAVYVFPVITGVLLVLVGFTDSYAVTSVALLLLGFFFLMFSTSANSIMQLNSPDEYRGRVMSVYSLVTLGTTPIGNLFAGGIAQSFNVAVSFIACGAATLLLLIPVLFYLQTKKGREQILMK